jgi:hypothetical protein
MVVAMPQTSASTSGRNRFAIFVVLSFVASCQGCFGCQTSPLDASSNLPRTCQSEAPLVEAQKLDILFVIDNSNSMVEEQAGVARELTTFVDQIRKAGGVRQDFHVGVVTTSVYLHSTQNGLDWYKTFPDQSGLLRPVPDFFADGGVNYDTTNERLLVGDDPDLGAKFERLVRQGVSGSGQETPFEATRLALLGDASTIPLAQGGNQGFVRDGARLLIVVLSDEDDCSEIVRPPLVKVSDSTLVSDCTAGQNSLYPVSEYYRLFTTQLNSSDGSPREMIWTAIAPVGRETKAAMAVIEGGQVRNIDCPTSNQAGFRHRAMAELFDPTLANLDSICKDSYHDTLIRIAELASVSQTLEVKNVPDEHMLQVAISRQDGTQATCTLANGGLTSFTREADGVTAKMQFGNQCQRRADDTSLKIRLLCAT